MLIVKLVDDMIFIFRTGRRDNFLKSRKLVEQGLYFVVISECVIVGAYYYCERLSRYKDIVFHSQ